MSRRLSWTLAGTLARAVARACTGPARDGDRDRLAQPGVLDEAARRLERGERLLGVGPVAGELDALAALEERAQQAPVLGRQLGPRDRDLEELLGGQLGRPELSAEHR